MPQPFPGLSLPSTVPNLTVPDTSCAATTVPASAQAWMSSQVTSKPSSALSECGILGAQQFPPAPTGPGTTMGVATACGSVPSSGLWTPLDWEQAQFILQ